MRRQSPLVSTVLAVSMIWGSGCRPQQPHYLFEHGDLSHYVGEATDIEYPDAEVESLEEVQIDAQHRPLTLEHGIDPDKIWPLTLEDAIRYALANNKILRRSAIVALTQINPSSSLAQVAAPEQLTDVPGADAAKSTYDPALAETDPIFGPEAALAAFDAQLQASLTWQKVDTPRNIQVNPLVETFFPTVDAEDLGTFSTSISKTNATGGTTTLRHNVRYQWSNSPTRAFPSDWNVNLEAEFRQPLLQGAGVQFNRIAGPGATPGIYRGVVIARINTDIQLADFEAEVRDLLNDVERAYWALYLAYRQLDTARKARDSTLELWQHVYDLYQAGAIGGDAASESQVRERYFFYQGSAEQALSNLYAAEDNLRYVIGIAATDGRLIRPADEPTTAKIRFPWPEVHYEALARNVDLRRQRWRVKQREMELIAAKNYLLPRLDAVGLYRWLGLGDDLIYAQRKVNPEATAYQNLTGGRYQEWQFGLELSMPIGFRREMAGVRHAQLALARERSLLQEEELEVSHQLAQAIRFLQGQYQLAATGFSRLEAARHNVKVLTEKREQGAKLGEGPLEIKVLLDAQQNEAEAEGRFYGTLADYAMAIARVHFRKGSLLEYDNVYLAEGPWPAKAYFDATRHARERDAALYMDYGFTRPKVISRGPYEQHIGIDRGTTSEPQPEAAPEPIPSGKPLPLNAPGPGDNRSASAANGSPGAAWTAVLESRNTTAAPEGRSQASDDGWSGLAAVPTAPVPGLNPSDGVRPVSYQEPVRSPASQGGWMARQPGGLAASVQHEPVENPPPDQAHRPSSGWKKAQYGFAGPGL